MKKNIIILLLFIGLNNAHAITFDEIIKSAKDMWQTQKETRAPNFSLTDTNGNIHTQKTTRGKYLMINFWATWCPPCLKEIPAFVDFYEENQDKVLILGLNYEQANPQAIEEFTQGFMVNYPIVLFDEKNTPEFTKFGEVVAMPTTYIYNPEGKLIDFKMGEMDIKSLQEAISK